MEISHSPPAQRHARHLDRLQEVIHRRFGPGGTIHAAWAPGRVNLMGDHTDYNDGFVLPMTLDRAVYVAMRARKDERIRIHAINFEETLDLDAPGAPLPDGGRWMQYVAGVIEEVDERYGLGSGLEGVIYGDVPLGAGLSSSAALEVAVARGVDALFGLELDPVETARLCQHVEHRYVGMKCGIMDQFAARLGRSGHALFLDCRSLAFEHVPLELGSACIVITNSNTHRELASSKYNERRGECAEAVRRLQALGLKINTLRDLTPGQLDEHRSALASPLADRCMHVVSENERAQKTRSLLAEGRLEPLGRLMFASHESLRDQYAVSVPELDTLVEAARGTEGVLGARMTGGGFGGCTVSLVEKAHLPTFMQHTRSAFARRHGYKPAFYVVEDNLESGTKIIPPDQEQ